MSDDVTYLVGDSRETLRTLPAKSVQMCVTSPPYWGLRDYKGGEREIGQEETPEEFIANLVDVFREVRQVLRDDGVVFVNLGDTYASGTKGTGGDGSTSGLLKDGRPEAGRIATAKGSIAAQRHGHGLSVNCNRPDGDLLLIPHRFAMAMQSDGWLCRNANVWAKASTMPFPAVGWHWSQHRESCECKGTTDDGKADPACDVCGRQGNVDCPGCPTCTPNGGLVLKRGSWRHTSSHESIFMFAKSMGYMCVGEQMQEAVGQNSLRRSHLPGTVGSKKHETVASQPINGMPVSNYPATRNPRDVLHETPPAPYEALPWLLDLTEQTGEQGILREWCRYWRWSLDVALLRRVAKSMAAPGDVWKLKQSSFAGKHYAVFPPSLPERCIMAGTSDEGECAECGSAWVPVVERTATVGQIHASAAGQHGRDGRALMADRPGQFVDGCSNVLGYKPSCICNAPSIPQTVLDPFGGAGTTAVAARKLGRRAILCELNPEHVQLTQDRLSGKLEAEAKRERAAKKAAERGQGLLFGDAVTPTNPGV